jgi:hypothetical protein
VINRLIESQIDAKGTLHRTVRTLRTANFAGALRSTYRYQAPSERMRTLGTMLADRFPGASVDTLAFRNLDQLGDTLEYRYRFSVPNAASLSGNTAVLALNLPDQITGESFPSEQKRHYDIDMAHTWFGIGSFATRGTLKVPEGWKLINEIEPETLEIEGGKYQLEVRQVGNVVQYRRRARFDFSEPVKAENSKQLRAFLSRVARTDNVQLIFMVEQAETGEGSLSSGQQ